jgi:hypothetical protein
VKFSGREEGLLRERTTLVEAGPVIRTELEPKRHPEKGESEERDSDHVLIIGLRAPSLYA